MGGCAKSMIQIGDRTILESLVHALRAGGCGQVNVLVGAHASTIRPVAERCGVSMLKVSNPQGSLMATQRDAVKLHLRHHADADMMVTVADLPLIRSPHIRILLSAWQQAGRRGAIAPIVDGQRGHPLILAASTVRELAASGARDGIRGWLKSNSCALTCWPSSEPAYVTDLDKPEDLARLRAISGADALQTNGLLADTSEHHLAGRL